jgi:hypothetical protein
MTHDFSDEEFEAIIGEIRETLSNLDGGYFD